MKVSTSQDRDMTETQFFLQRRFFCWVSILIDSSYYNFVETSKPIFFSLFMINFFN